MAIFSFCVALFALFWAIDCEDKYKELDKKCDELFERLDKIEKND